MGGAREKNLGGFLEELKRKGLREGSVIKYAVTLNRFWIGRPRLTLEACNEIFTEIKEADFTAITKKDYWRRFRVFARWVKPELDLSGYKVVAKVKRKLPNELLDVEEARSIVNCCESIRNKAMVALLYDSGCRPGELLNLRRQDISFDGNGMVVRFDGKTGTRRIRIVTTLGSDRLLQEYVGAYPNLDKLIRVTLEGLGKIVKRAARRAGMKKRMYSYLFRHSRATELAKYLTEAQQKVYLGWDAASEMPSIYVHLCGRDLDPRVLELNMKENSSEMPGDFKEFMFDLYREWQKNKVRAEQRTTRATLRALR